MNRNGTPAMLWTWETFTIYTTLIITDVLSCFVVYYKIRYGITWDEYEHSRKNVDLEDLIKAYEENRLW